jgi:hypothetical protein
VKVTKVWLMKYTVESAGIGPMRKAYGILNLKLKGNIAQGDGGTYGR